MNAEEAVKILRREARWESGSYREALDVAIAATLKQMPMTAEFSSDGYSPEGIEVWDAKCPTCGHDLAHLETICPKCGQVISWMEGEIDMPSYVDNAYAEFVKSLKQSDKEFVRRMLEEFEKEEKDVGNR